MSLSLISVTVPVLPHLASGPRAGPQPTRTSKYVHTYATEFAALPSWFFGLVAGAFGAIFASFFGVLAERLPRHETLGGRSHCVCGAPLGAANIPIFGWLFLCGRASCCGARIPVRYLFAEVFLAGAWATTAALRPHLWVFAIVVVVSSALTLAFSWRRPTDTPATDDDFPRC